MYETKIQRSKEKKYLVLWNKNTKTKYFESI